MTVNGNQRVKKVSSSSGREAETFNHTGIFSLPFTASYSKMRRRIFSLKMKSFTDWKAYQFEWKRLPSCEREFYETSSLIDRNHFQSVCFSSIIEFTFYLDEFYGPNVWDGRRSWLIRLLCDSQEFHFWPRFPTTNFLNTEHISIADRHSRITRKNGLLSTLATRWFLSPTVSSNVFMLGYLRVTIYNNVWIPSRFH